MNLAKTLKYGLLIAAVLFSSCSEDDSHDNINELGGLELVSTMNNSNHTIEFYTPNGKLQTGYNDISFQIKKPDGSLVENAKVSWIPRMHMINNNHSCPASEVVKKKNTAATYNGHIIFQMPTSDTEYWELTVNYLIEGAEFTATKRIEIVSSKRVVESFTGADNKRYVLALVQPSKPRVAINDMKVALYSMESAMSFVAVDEYKIKIDPRMPAMGNHGSPNNVNLVQGEDSMYHGKLSLTMTGYWKINMQLEDKNGSIQKGEAVTASNESSSIYFELEF